MTSAMITIFAPLALLFASVSAFEIGKEYVYKYGGELRIQNSGQPLQSAGFAFRSKLVVQPQADSTHFKLLDFGMDQFNSDTIDETGQHFNYHSNEALKNSIERPFAAKFSEGKVESAHLGNSEPLWSQNIKKGVLSLFQLDLVNARANDPHAKQYNVKEETLRGLCEVLYIVDEEGGQLKVTKVKNLDKCEKEPTKFFGSVKGKPCTHDVRKPLAVTSGIEFTLNGTSAQYFINEATAVSEQLFRPYGDGVTIRTTLHRYLRLLEHKDATTDIQLPADSEQVNGLSQTFPDTADVKTTEQLKEQHRYIADYGVNPYKQQFAPVFNKLAAMKYTESDIKNLEKKQSGADLFLGLYHMMVTLGYEDVKEAYDKQVVNGPPERKEDRTDLFVDILLASGFNPHLAFGLELIKDGKITEAQEQRFLSKVSLSVKEPSQALITEMAELCRNKQFQLRKSWPSCILGVSAVSGGDGCIRAKNDQEQDRGTCAPEIVAQFFNYSVTPEDVKDDSERKTSTYLKAAGNLATRKAVRSLARFISAEGDQPIRRRMSAIWSLLRAAPKHPELALTIALPVYENRSEPHSVRIGAFIVTIMANPGLHVLRHIAENIMEDPSDQVVSYVVSAFRELSKSDYPCHSGLVAHLRYVLPIWDNVEHLSKAPDRTSSHITLSTKYDPKYGYGGFTAFSTIQSHDSNLPESIYFRVNDYVAGLSYDTVSVKFESRGLDKYLSQLLGPQPGSTKNLWNVMGRRRFTRDASSKDRKELEDALTIAPRSYDPAYLCVTLNMFGNDIDVWEFDESALNGVEPKSPDETLKSLLKSDGPKKSFALVNDLAVLVPTEAGFPVFYDFKESHAIYRNTQSLNIGTKGTKMGLSFKGHYVYESKVNNKVAVLLSFNKTMLGTGLNAETIMSVPVDLQAALDAANGKLSVARPLDVPWDVMSVKATPTTFATPYDVSNGVLPVENSIKPIYKDDDLKQFEKSYFGDALGFAVKVKGSLLSKGLHEGLHQFWHEMDWRQRSTYFMHNPNWHPRNIKMSIVPADHDVTKRIELDIGYKFYRPEDKRESHFDVQDAVDGDTKTTSTHALSVDAKLLGDSKERKLSAELRYSMSKDSMNHKVQFFYERSPFLKDEQNKMKICLDISSRFPSPDWSRVNQLATFYQGQSIDSKGNLYYGSNCKDQSSLSFVGKFTHTDEDEKHMQENLLGDLPSQEWSRAPRLRKLHSQCIQLQKQGLSLNHFCMRYLFQTSRLGKLTMDVRYKNLKPIESIGALEFLQTSENVPPGFFGVLARYGASPNGKLHLVSQVPAFEKPSYADINVTTEDGETYRHEHVPIFSHLLEPRIFTSFGYTNIAEYSAHYRNRVCDLQGDSVKTFDGLIVNLPKTDCFKVVARDCSPNKRFVVLAKETESYIFKKALRVFIHDVKVDIYPIGPDGGQVERVDGKVIEVSNKAPYRHVYHGAELFKITKSRNFYKITSRPYGLYIGFNGNLLFVQVANLYRGKMCGLCGDYNYDKHRELVGANGELYTNTLEFAKSYVVPSSDCTPPSRS